jgi:exopolysaccharide biosynthesis protein
MEVFMSLKVTKLPSAVYVKEIDPDGFEVHVCDCGKRDVLPASNYFNLRYFAQEDTGRTVTIGNVANDGQFYSEANTTPAWINVANKSLTTIYTTSQGTCWMRKVNNLKKLYGCKAAVSGIPIIFNGNKQTMSRIKAEGYFGNELYDTWHGFLGIRNNKLVYVAAKCVFEDMYPLMVSLGIQNAIKLDGGGSFILKESGTIIQSTSGNRRINSVGVWK